MSGLACRHLSARYNGTTVLDDVDLAVAPGEWLAVIGPNGAGKTTLLRTIAGSIPARGAIRVGATALEDMTRREVARAVAVVPQQPIIPSGMSVFDYVLLGRTPYIPYWGSEGPRDVRVTREVIRRLDLEPLAGRRLGTLSGGERQRAILGRALAQDAGVLLLDEPTTALDIGHQQQVMELVDELRVERSIAVLSAVHDLTVAAQYADRLVLLASGRVVAEGAAVDVLTEELLTRFYGARVSILRDGAGRIVVATAR